jgi:hypothetical protein
MKLFKYIFSILLQLGAFFLCIWLSGILSIDHWGFAIFVNFLFMIVFTIIFGQLLAPVFLTKYFLSKPFEKEGRIYLRFGVRYYKYLLRIIGWEKIIRKDQPIKNNYESLLKYKTWTQVSEAIHLFASICVIAFTIWIGWRFSIGDVYWLILLNIMVNVFPVILQRYNRPRVIHLLKIYEMRMNKTI